MKWNIAEVKGFCCPYGYMLSLQECNTLKEIAAKAGVHVRTVGRWKAQGCQNKSRGCVAQDLREQSQVIRESYERECQSCGG